MPSHITLSLYSGLVHLGKFSTMIIAVVFADYYQYLWLTVVNCSTLLLSYILSLVFLCQQKGSFTLGLLQLHWFRLPLVAHKPSMKKNVSIICVMELINTIIDLMIFPFLLFHSTVMPISIAITHYVFCCLSIPYLYTGAVFTKQKYLPPGYSLRIIVEAAISSLFASVLFQIDKFWIIVVCYAWRVFLVIEPYSFWCSMHALLSPFEAMLMAKGARLLLTNYMLHFEQFLYFVLAFWLNFDGIENKIFVLLFGGYYIVFFLYEVVSLHIPTQHRIEAFSAKDLNNAIQPEPEML